MARIEFQMNVKDALVAMCDSNPGCINVLMALVTSGDQIDPDATLGGFASVLLLDTLEIYGSRVWMLFKDVCGQDLTKTIAVLRGYQLGYLKRAQVNHAIDNRGDGIDVNDVLEKVRARLPKFGAAAERVL